MGSLYLKVTALPSQCTYVLNIGAHTHSRCPIVGKFYPVDAVYVCHSDFLPPTGGEVPLD
jgi:hypothetical protein